MRFEQPKHLTKANRVKQIRGAALVFLFPSVLLSVVTIAIPLQRYQAGREVSDWEWILAASIGLIQFLLVRLGLYISLSSARYIEFKGDKIDLAERGKIAISRIKEWSLTPDTLAPGCLRLRIIYKFGFGRKRWSMLLDDQNQADQLKIALNTAVPFVASPY